MLSEMSSREWIEWGEFYQERYFVDDLIDTHFASLSHLVVSFFADPKKHNFSVADFSLLGMSSDSDEDISDEQLMSIGESIAGGVRYVPASG
ncbi:phage tail assembly protein T [Raoultella ornithinolytica]|uniref:Phage tail assembly protein T n=1 Tax=Raoultella ornithinolytica TaxID=54291 RepID=A0A9Q9MZP3_RAOOR|nr:phage tail assembly protein T [Raoultella ornithinolytica]UXE39626.1 phage tail assembly protein T [Raoultella ornithinolytica]